MRFCYVSKECKIFALLTERVAIGSPPQIGIWHFILLILLCFTFYGDFRADPSGDIDWKCFETKFTLIRYRSPESLIQFVRKLNYGPQTPPLYPPYSDSKADPLIANVTQKVDAIYLRVQMILDMQRQVKKVTINLYPNQHRLQTAYAKIFSEPCKVRAFYVHKYNSLYLNAEDIHEGMLAHELAHAVIDHYLLIRLPTASAEILARYVESHLHQHATNSGKLITHPPDIQHVITLRQTNRKVR